MDVADAVLVVAVWVIDVTSKGPIGLTASLLTWAATVGAGILRDSVALWCDGRLPRTADRVGARSAVMAHAGGTVARDVATARRAAIGGHKAAADVAARPARGVVQWLAAEQDNSARDTTRRGASTLSWCLADVFKKRIQARVP